MPTILVADDSEVERRLIEGLLRKHGDFQLEFVEHGQAAVESMERGLPDLIVTDLIMPQMNGLELVRVVRSRWPHVPVILMTAYGNETIAVDALEQGAASYVPKSQRAERLLGTIERVLARTAADQSRQRLIRCLAAIGCFFSLENDPDLIAPLVNMVQEILSQMGIGDATERVRLGIALEEALVNAMVHGNLEITEEELAGTTSELREQRQRALVNERRGRYPYCDRRITVNTHMSTFGARFVVRDEGHGFDPAEIASDGGSENFEIGRSRGLTLMQKIMDEVNYNDQGNEVTMIRRCQPKAPPQPAMAGQS